MPEIDLSRFVVVATPQRHLGTGYRLTETRILTCWHVVRDQQELVVKDPSGLGWHETSAEVIWPGEDLSIPEPLDAALLRTDPVEVSPWTRLRPSRVDRPLSFTTYGYTGESKRPQDRLYVDGKMAAYQEGETSAQLTVSHIKASNVKSLGGISGSPVLYESRKGKWVVGGVVRSGSKPFHGSVLRYVPTSELCSVEGFLQALDLPKGSDAETRTAEKFARRVEDLLNDEVLMELKERFAVQGVELGDKSHCARYLCSPDHQDPVVQTLAKLNIDLHQDGRHSLAEKLDAILRLALPGQLASRYGGDLPEPELRVHRAHGSTEIQAEVFSSTLDGRAMDLSEPWKSHSTEVPRASFQVPLEAQFEEGFATPEEKAEGLARELATRLLFLAPREAATPAQAGDQKVLADFIARLCTVIWRRGDAPLLPASYVKIAERKAPDDPEEQAGALIQMVNELLANHFEDAGRRFYYLAEAAGPEGAALLEELEIRFPELRGIELDGEGDTKMEMKIGTLFRDMFRNRARARQSVEEDP